MKVEKGGYIFIDSPNETFRVLKEKEGWEYGKYRTRRLERIGKRPLIGCD
jgi:hypothetical protein